MRDRVFLGFALAVATVGWASCSRGDDAAVGDEHAAPACRTDLTRELGRLRVPGLSAAIIVDGQLACTAVAGQADIEAGRAVEPDTVFAWASVSKTVTATAAMMLRDDGAFDLDDDIDDYLPFAVDNPACPGEPITFRQLLTHTSSIRDNWPIYDKSYVIGDSPIALGDYVRGYLVPGGAYYDGERNFKDACPGEVYAYSNVAVGLLGYLLEEISGSSFDELCRQRIFDPLGMQQTSFVLSELDLDGVAMPYDGHTHFEPHGHVGYPTIADGLLRTSAPHLGRFLAMFAGHGALGGERLLAEETADEMRRLQIPELDDTQGLIWYYESIGREGLLGHDGDDPGTSSLMFFDPADGDGVLLVANGVWRWPEAHRLFGELFAEAERF